MYPQYTEKLQKGQEKQGLEQGRVLAKPGNTPYNTTDRSGQTAYFFAQYSPFPT
jgi:hypothetical protein